MGAWGSVAIETASNMAASLATAKFVRQNKEQTGQRHQFQYTPSKPLFLYCSDVNNFLFSTISLIICKR
jgi:phospholipase/lecithinase/hemolysin